MAQESSIRILKFIINYAGGYTDQFSRPYETHCDGVTLKNLEQCIHGNNGYTNQQLVSGQMFGALAADFVRPQADPGRQIQIAGGWGETRITFLMEVEIVEWNGSKVQLIQGYSNYSGDPSYRGSIDPNCIFYINSITNLREVRVPTPYGQQSIQTVASSAHVIIDRDWADAGGYNGWMQQGGMNSNIRANMRPQDVYSVMAQPELMRAHQGTLDFRTSNTSLPLLSQRSNGLPTDYMGKIMKGYQGAISQPASDESLYSIAIGQTAENVVSKDKFIAKISQSIGSVNNVQFTFGELLQMDRTVLDRMSVIQPSNVSHGPIDFRNYSQVMTGSNAETQAAAMLFNGIPALMARFGLTALAFTATNRHQDGPQFLFANAQGYRGHDVTPSLLALQQRIQIELLDSISMHGAIDYAITAKCLITQDTHLDIALNGGQSIPFASPTYADAMFAPVVASNRERLVGVTNDFEILLGETMSVTPGLETHFDYTGDFGNPNNGLSI